MLRWLIAILGASMGVGNFLFLAIIVFLLLAAFGGSKEAWWLLGMIVVIGVITVAHENRKAEKELKRLRGEPDDEDSNKHLRLYAFLGISLVVGIALFCFFLSQIHEPTPTRRPLTPEEIRVEDSLRQAYRRERDSIEKAQKAEHVEYVRKMARDIVNSGRRERSRDNMRGWDPASEDDLDDNGMDRYSNANDDEGWN